MGNWEENVRKVIPYVPGEQPSGKNIIKLNTNECPYPPSKEVKAALNHIIEDRLRLYPDPCVSELVEELATYYEVSSDNVFVGVGSDDVLAMAFLTFFNSKSPILFPDITYSFYDVWADLFQISYERKPLDEMFFINKMDYMVENGGIIIPNPNAPTGIFEPLETIEEIIKNNQDVVVIIDEAYVDFGGESAIFLTKKYENLLVVQTFSKSRALAGMRIGYAIGSKKLIKFLNDAKFSFNSYTMNLTSIKAGVACIKDGVYFKEIVKKVIDTREWTKKELTKLGFSYTDSKSNFVFVTHPTYEAKMLFESCMEANIYVRYFNKPRINNYLRISIGTQLEMEQLINHLKEIVKDGKNND
ncbi:MAG: histidinol-phosphate transaminase [Lachnospiraceae bacterium]